MLPPTPALPERFWGGREGRGGGRKITCVWDNNENE